MGLTANSTGKRLLVRDVEFAGNNSRYTIAIAGNPNVGKSTIFNSLTGMNQHTGNWPGKTVENSTGICKYNQKEFLLVDIPGTYSIMSNSEEEEIARDYICFGNPDATVVILDGTCLERNLNLVYQIMEITPNIIVCVNLLDEAKSKGIKIDLELLEDKLGVPVIGTIARKKKTLDNLMRKVEEVCENKNKIEPKKIKYIPIIEDCIKMLNSKVQKMLIDKNEYISRWISLKLIDREEIILKSIEKNLEIDISNDKEINRKLVEIESLLNDHDINKDNIRNKIVSTIILEAESICKEVIRYENNKYKDRDRKIDKVLTSKIFGIPIMILFLGIILWLTIAGANYPGELLTKLFSFIQEKLVYVFELFNAPDWIKGILIDGMYCTVAWVISVMLPPMAIFFPLFTLLEDLGYLPRIAFNLDKYFKRACSSRKTSINYVYGNRM